MRYFGYSTGAIAKNDVNAAMDCLRDTVATAIEVSALRLHELKDALDFVVNRDSKRFSYVSFHAPSRFTAEEEDMVLRSLAVVAERNWPIVAHPDMIHTPARWRAFGSLLLIENMDQRKPIGRTADELDPVFAVLPEAGLCFDLGHAKQVDPSMTEAYRILHRHGRRLKQIHLSDVDNDSKHHPLNIPALNDFFRVAPFVNRGAAVILEAVVPPAEVNAQLLMAQFFFAAADAHRWIKLQSKANEGHREWFANTSQILVNGTPLRVKSQEFALTRLLGTLQGQGQKQMDRNLWRYFKQGFLEQAGITDSQITDRNWTVEYAEPPSAGRLEVFPQEF